MSQAIHVHAYESCMHVGSVLHFYYSLNIQNFNLTHSHVVYVGWQAFRKATQSSASVHVLQHLRAKENIQTLMIML